MTFPASSLDHIVRLTDDVGIAEHAMGSVPRRDHGYCTDDNGRALAVVSRDRRDPRAAGLAGRYLAFLLHAHTESGAFHLRMSFDRRWTEDPASDDANGRAIFGLGVAVAKGPESLRWTAHELFRSASPFRSHFPRATAHAAIGAAELLAIYPDDPNAIALLQDAATSLPHLGSDPAWPWPEPRLAYANALIPEALIAVGAALGSAEALDAGLKLLSWLVEEETREGRFSFAPTGGRGPGGERPAFDQQPIEAASVVEAAARAFAATGERSWLDVLGRGVAWFLGENDASTSLLDPLTGGCADGLHASGLNRNQGAESTLMSVIALQHAEALLASDAERQGRAAASATKT